MKREKRNYTISRLDHNAPEASRFCNMPSIIKYKGKYCILGKGDNGYYAVFRYGTDFAVLSYHPGLNYASLMTIDPETMEETGDVFIANVDEIETNRPFMDYTENTMAAILTQHIGY